MQEAAALAADPDFRSGGNPRVGCVVLAADGRVIGRGHHRGAGQPHAEAVALAQAGADAAGGTAIVTLEPCRHTGRTSPCTDALIEAGIARVVFAVADPTERGGADVLRAAGIDVVSGVGSEVAAPLVHDWVHVQRTGRPWVIIKCAMSLDGRVAGADGQPQAITGDATNAESQLLRATCDAIIVGTGTVHTDNPRLTVRGAKHQPLRVVIGESDIPEDARMRGTEFRQYRTHDVAQVLTELAADGCLRVLVEGGPTLQSAFWRADCIDAVRWTVSPVFLGMGPGAGAGGGDPIAVTITEVRTVGEDVVITGHVGA